MFDIKEETALAFRHFPHQVFLVLHLPTNSYGCVLYHGRQGLACFSEPDSAQTFALSMETNNNLIIEVPMADACEIAAEAGLMMLVLSDLLDSPLVHNLQARKSHS